MRVLLVTGADGVETTTVTAALAAGAARQGVKTALLDGPASRPRDWPVVEEPGLIVGGDLTGSGHGQGQDTESLEPGSRSLLAELGAQLGLDPLPDVLMPTLPGLAEIAWLLGLADDLARAPADLMVVDLGGARSAARLLAAPSGLHALVDHALPVGRRIHRAMTMSADPAGRLADVVRQRLRAAQDVLADEGSALWLLHRRGRIDQVAHWAPRLAAYGCRVRPVPDDVDGGAAGADADRVEQPARRVVAEAGGYDLLLDLPHARRADLQLHRLGDDLVLDVSAGDLPPAVVGLPAVLRRCRITAAALDRPGRLEAALRVRFEPDPELWPQP